MPRLGSLVLSIIILAVTLLPNLTHPTPAYAADVTVPLPTPEDPLGQQPEQKIPEISMDVDVRDGHLTARVVDIWGPGRVPLVYRSYTNAESNPLYKPNQSAVPLYNWHFSDHLDILGTDVLGPDGNRTVYKYSSDRWNGTTEMWQVYVNSIGAYSTMEMRHTCTPPPPPCGRECLRPSRAQAASPKPGFRIQGATASPPAGCTGDGTHKVYLSKGVVRSYQSGRIIEEKDANGNATTFTYTTFADGVGSYLSTVTDSVGRQITYTNTRAFQKCVKWSSGQENIGECVEYKWVYKPTIVRDPYNRTATYTYDGSGNILSVLNSAGHTTNYTYLTGLLMDSVKNARQHTTTITWISGFSDNKWRVSTVTAPGPATTRYSYTVTADANNVYRVFRTVVTNARNYATTYDMYTGTDGNYFGNLERVTDPLGNVIQYQYDARHNLTQVTDPRQNRTTYQYNGRNKPTQIVQAAGTVNLTTTLEWDGNDNLLTVTNPRGFRTEYAYNGTHNLTSVKRAAGTVDESLTQYTYNSWGGVATSISPRNHTTTFGYTARRQLQTVIPPAGGGGTTTYNYDAFDDQVTVTNGNNRSWTTAYNASRLITSTTDPLTHRVRHEYDANGNRTHTYDAKNQPTTFGYDARDRLITITDALNGITRYDYDDVNNLTRITNARQFYTIFTYNAANRLIQVNDALNQPTTYGYDPAGNRNSMRDRRGANHTYEHDQANRVTRVSAGGLEVTHEYDANGNRIVLTDGNGPTRFNYDSLDRLSRKTTPDGRFIAYAYDRSGNRTRLTYPDNSTTLDYSYDPGNRLTQIAQGSLSWTFSYDAAGNRLALAQPNGTRSEYVYRANNWLQSITHKRPDGSAFQSFTYTYDENGNRVSQAEPAGAVNLGYDALNRLISASYQGPYGNWSWDYDAVGNRIRQTAPSGITNYTYDGNNRLTAAGAVTYSYDGNGNLTSTTAGQTFVWDAFNRLRQASGSGGSVTYTYNGDGEKIRRTGPDGSTVYYYDGIRPVWEADGAGNLKAQLDRDIFGNLLSRRETNGTRRYLAHDGLGGTTGITDEAGAYIVGFAYDAWGNIRASAGTWTGGLYLFTGAELDSATGLYHMGARFYDPAIGRWLSEDPLQDNQFDPLTLNYYAYVQNNPLILLDPDGQSAAVAAYMLGLAGISFAVPGLQPVAVGIAIAAIALGVGNVMAMAENTKHLKEVAAGQLGPALEHASKLATPGGPKDPRGNWTRELRAKLDKIRQQVNRLGKSYEQILRELYAQSPERLAKALSELARLIEALKKLGIDPADFFEPTNP